MGGLTQPEWSSYISCSYCDLLNSSSWLLELVKKLTLPLAAAPRVERVERRRRPGRRRPRPGGTPLSGRGVAAQGLGARAPRRRRPRSEQDWVDRAVVPARRRLNFGFLFGVHELNGS